MKKVFLVSSIALAFMVFLYLNANFFKFLWGAQIIMIPIISGALMAFVQDKHRSYAFLPGVISGSFFTSFIFVVVIQAIECFNYNYGPHCPISSLSSITPFVLILCGFFIFGGLVGIATKGIVILLNNKVKIS